MSGSKSITVILANRPRLLRELLQYALKTASAKFHVIESADPAPAASVLRDADWVVLDVESASEAASLTAEHPRLGILVLEGLGSHARVVAPASRANQELTSDSLTLSSLFNLLAKVPDHQTS